MGGHPMENTAVPVLEPRLAAQEAARSRTTPPRGGARHRSRRDDTRNPVHVPGDAVDHRPAFLAAATAASGQLRITGDPDLPDDRITLSRMLRRHRPIGSLDPAAGHGTFIAGIIEQLAPGCTIKVQEVIGPLGDTNQFEAGNEVHRRGGCLRGARHATAAAHPESVVAQRSRSTRLSPARR